MMRTVSPTWRTLIGYTHPIHTRVGSYLADQQIAANVPITTGQIQFDDTGVVKRRLTISVPALDGLTHYDPAGNPTAPLAAYGQRLHVLTGVGYPNGATELLDLGWYLITKWQRSEDGGTIDVEAVDLAQLLVDFRLPAAESPPAGATFSSEFGRLVAGVLPVVIDAGLVNRAVPASLVWDRDRDKALSDLCAAWPARWYIGDDGAAHAGPPYPVVTPTAAPDVTLTDGQAGTIVARARQGERGAIYNQVVVDGAQPDDGSKAPHAVKEITAASSPIRAAGPYGRVTRFYASDLITTTQQANDAASSLLVTYSTAGRAETVTAVPDPSIQLGDVARVTTRDGQTFTGRITSLTVPLTVDQAPMQLSVSMLPGGLIDDPGTAAGF